MTRGPMSRTGKKMKFAEVVLQLEFSDEYRGQEGGLVADIVAAIGKECPFVYTVRQIHQSPARLSSPVGDTDISTIDKRESFLHWLAAEIQPVTLNDCASLSQAQDS